MEQNLFFCFFNNITNNHYEEKVKSVARTRSIHKNLNHKFGKFNLFYYFCNQQCIYQCLLKSL